MQTYTGRRFYPLDPRPEDIHPEDIAHALSMLCRFGGHVVRFYSVAEHCLHVASALAPEHQLAGLLHDATEAYVQDLVRPVKHQLLSYMALEDTVALAIAERFGLDPVMPPEVKVADNRVLLDERRAVMCPTADTWAQDDLEPLGVTIYGFQPADAERAYLCRLHTLLADA